MLTVEQWEALSVEEQKAQKDDMPESLREHKDDLTLEELNQKIKDLEKSSEEDKGRHSTELSGLIQDLKQERAARQEAEGKLKDKDDLNKDDPLKKLENDDPVTAGDLKTIRAQEAKAVQDRKISDIKEKAAERMDNDEDRMHDKTATKSDEFPVTYAKALEAFDKLVKADPSLWTEVHQEALRRRGHPALTVYRLAMTKDPELSKLVKSSEREKVIEELKNRGLNIPKKIAGGKSTEGEIDLENMSDEELLKAVGESPEKVDKAMGKK